MLLCVVDIIKYSRVSIKSMSHLKAFNTQLVNFIQDLVRQYPKDGDLIIYGEAIETLVKIDSRKCLTNFIKYVYPHKKEIMSEDDSYFLGYNVSGHSESTDEIEKLSDKIKKIWETNCTDDTKKTIWKYFKVLIILSEKAIVEIGALGGGK